MNIPKETRVRILAPRFAGQFGVVDYVAKKSESYNCWNYSVLVFQLDAPDADGSEFYCFSRDELEPVKMRCKRKTGIKRA